MRRRTSLMASLAILAAATASADLAYGQATSAPADSSAAVTPGPLKITVSAVQGGGQYREPGQTKWQAVAAGAVLNEGVELRTGPKGAIQFTVGTDQVYRVDRLTVVKVLRASLVPDGTIKTDVGMQYGRVSKDVDSPVRPHDDTIVTPSSTLAVRGTRVSLYDQPPYEPEAVSLTGAALFGIGKQVTAFGAKGQGTASVNSSHPDAADYNLNKYIVDPSIASARTPAENKLLADLRTNGAVVDVSNPLTLPMVANSPPPPTSALAGLVPGNLVFYIRWDTDTHVQMKLIAAAGPGHIGEFVFPVLGLNVSPSGGKILFDNLGGPSGGWEVITYQTTAFPNGLYGLGAVNQGPLPTTVTFDAFITNPKTGVLETQDFTDFNARVPTADKEIVKTASVGGTAGAVAEVDQQSPNKFSGVPAGSGGTNPFSPPTVATRTVSKKHKNAGVTAPAVTSVAVPAMVVRH